MKPDRKEEESLWHAVRTAVVAALRAAAPLVAHPWGAVMVALAAALAISACVGALEGAASFGEGDAVTKFCGSWSSRTAPLP